MTKPIISVIKNIFHRQQASQSLSDNIKSGIGGLIAIASLAWLSAMTNSLLLMAPFGATCVLLFSLPNSPLSQPANVIGGHLISSLIGIVLAQHLPAEWWSLGLAVGLSISAMGILRITHPPAGADPLVIYMGGFGWEYLAFPVISGCILLTLIAWAFYKWSSKIKYPNK